MTTSAAAVSRLLRRNGMLPVPRHLRDGLSVARERTGSVCLIASVVSGSSESNKQIECELLDTAIEILTSRGYVVSRPSRNIAYASKGA